MFKTAICNNWASDISGYAQSISILEESGFPAWTVKLANNYGVAIPYEKGITINENFANAYIYSDDIVLYDGTVKRVLLLTTSIKGIENIFSTLCCDLITPENNGVHRKEITDNPLNWWKKWKELLGNCNIDPRVYDVLGELCVLKVLLASGEDANWNGPEGASYDIETETGFVEVKSTIVRDKKEVTISNTNQLSAKGKTLNLIFCQFEPVVVNGISIDSVIEEIEQLGYNTAIINKKLNKIGLGNGKSVRKQTFILHNMIKYVVDSNFPKITPESFIGGVLPKGINKITYTVDLSILDSESII